MRPQDPGGGSESLSQGGHHQSSSCGGGGGGSRDHSLVNVSLSLVRSTVVTSDDDLLRRIGWGKAYDTNTGRYYYFKLDRSTRVWENPLTLSSVQDVDVRAHQRDVSGEAVPSDDDLRQIGWGKAYDTNTGRHYYFKLDRSKVVWENPLSISSSHQHRKRSRSPDPQTTVIQNAMEDLTNLATGIERRSHYANNKRRPLGSINGAAPRPMTSNGSQRHHNAATLYLGWYGVNNMRSHRNHQQQQQYHHYPYLMGASQQRLPLASYRQDYRMQALKINKMNNIPELIQAAHSYLSVMRPPNTAAFWNFLAKHMNENNQLNLRYEQMGFHINQLFQHTRRTLEVFGVKDLTQTTYSMAKLVASLRKLGSSSFNRKDHIASLLSNLLLNDDGGIREDLFLSLANASVHKMDQFGARHISNLAYAYALIRFVPVLADGSDLFHQVAKAAIQRKEDFNSQGVANLLWSYAKMGVVDGQLFLFSSFAPIAAKLIDSYNNQELANTAWAYAVADIDAPALFNDRFIDKCLGKRNGFSLEDLSQLHQWHLWQTKEKSNVGVPESLQDRCYKAFTSQSVHPSKFQEDVVSQLSSIGLNPKEEELLGSGYRIDAIVEVKGKTIGVEVDGPSHFIGRSKSPLAKTILKRRQVPSIDGIELVSVPYWEWDKPGKSQAKKQAYLRTLLNL